MQMIADGKIKQGTKIKIVGRFAKGCDKYFIFDITGDFPLYDMKNKLYDNGKSTGHVSLHDLIQYSFEILEDKTEEIEEMNTDRVYDFGELLDIENKINELVRAVNKLNKQDTSKETNCMSE